jgi:hypothetical protein
MQHDRPATPSRLDQVGIVLSGICLVHCIGLPILILLLPAIAFALPSDGVVHAVLIALVLPVSGFALWRGMTQSGSRWALFSGVAGMSLLALGLVFLDSETVATLLTVTGSLMIGLAHILNWRGHHDGAGDMAG